MILKGTDVVDASYVCNLMGMPEREERDLIEMV